MFFRISAGALMLFLGANSPAIAASPSAQYYGGGDDSLPFSAAVRIGNMVYLSGVIGVDQNGKLPTDFTIQATNAMQAVSKELTLAGATMDDVFKCDVALTDIKNWSAFNLVYGKYFKAGRLPVRKAAGVTDLAKGASVEVQCEAYTQ